MGKRCYDRDRCKDYSQKIRCQQEGQKLNCDRVTTINERSECTTLCTSATPHVKSTSLLRLVPAGVLITIQEEQAGEALTLK